MQLRFRHTDRRVEEPEFVSGLTCVTPAAKLQLCGGAIITYLLERTRVVSLAPSERNYHFLYQVCVCARVCLQGVRERRCRGFIPGV